MSQRVIIRHSTGSKSATVEEIPVKPAQELTFGREPGCDIRYDQDRDEYVSRRHMKLVVGDPDRLEFTVIELGARNGTFVNRRRVREPLHIKPGDVVQLGAGGPEFVFDFVREDLRETPVSGVVAVDESIGPQSGQPAPAPPDQQPAPAVPQESTSARRPKTTAGRHSPKKRAAGGLMVFGMLIAAAIYGVGRADAPAFGKVRAAARKLFAPRSGGKAPAALLTIETRWRLLEAEGGRPLRQIYIGNRLPGGGGPLVPGAGAELPVFVLLGPNRIEPLLTVADGRPYQNIGGNSTVAGFIIDSSGLAMTSDAAATPWNTPYCWPDGDAAGVVVVFDAQGKLAKTAAIARRQFPRWIPANADFVLEEAFDGEAATVRSHIRVTAVSDSLLTRAAAGQESVATLVSVSKAEGVAAVQSSAFIGTPPAAIAEDGEDRSGEHVQVLTGAGMKTGRLSVLPDGRYEVIGSDEGARRPGSPVFDSKGRIVAIETVGDSDAVVATPIHRALGTIRR